MSDKTEHTHTAACVYGADGGGYVCPIGVQTKDSRGYYAPLVPGYPPVRNAPRRALWRVAASRLLRRVLERIEA